MKHIGIDCRFWNQTGIGRYTQNIVSGLARLDRTNRYSLFFLSGEMDDVDLPENFEKVAVDIRWYTLKEQLFLPIIYYRRELDLLFVPNLNVPILYFKKFVVTLHDLTHIKVKTGKASTLPYPLYLLKRAALRLPLYYSAFFAKKIFTVSEYVKADLMKNLGIKPEKIVITVNAVSADFYPRDNDEVEEVRKKYGISGRYLFYVGNAHPHKNLEYLIEAFELVLKEEPDLMLVLGGKKTYFYELLERKVEDLPVYKNLIFTDYIDETDLPALYSGSEAFVNPSLEEGFGIQVLESFACGTKVVCSNTSSLPEVGGNIAYYFDPLDIRKMAHTILLCLKDFNPKRKEAGFQRVKAFSWDRSAQTVLEVLNS